MMTVHGLRIRISDLGKCGKNWEEETKIAVRFNTKSTKLDK